jgi:hypothetical protein
MTTGRIHGLLWALALTTVPAAPAAAQAVAFSEAAAPRRPALAHAYHLRLESAWPQAGAVGDGCRNGGDEVVEGLLTRGPDGLYRGSLDRRTLLLFCGAHGAEGTACELVLEGDGKVAMTGHVVADARSPSGSALQVSWRPSRTHGAAVRGACSADFKRSIEGMYRSVAHGAAFALPAAGAGRRTEQLEDYAWTVEVTGR